MADEDLHFRTEYDDEEEAEPPTTDFRACAFPASSSMPRDEKEASEIAEVQFAKLDKVDYREFARLRRLAERHKFRR